MTVFENVAYPLRAMGLRGEEVRKRVVEALQLVQLEPLAERYSSQISGGQQQRVALARILVGEPKLLLFDEPLSNLERQPAAADAHRDQGACSVAWASPRST